MSPVIEFSYRALALALKPQPGAQSAARQRPQPCGRSRDEKRRLLGRWGGHSQNRRPTPPLSQVVVICTLMLSVSSSFKKHPIAYGCDYLLEGRSSVYDQKLSEKPSELSCFPIRVVRLHQNWEHRVLIQTMSDASVLGVEYKFGRVHEIAHAPEQTRHASHMMLIPCSYSKVLGTNKSRALFRP